MSLNKAQFLVVLREALERLDVTEQLEIEVSKYGGLAPDLTVTFKDGGQFAVRVDDLSAG